MTIKIAAASVYILCFIRYLYTILHSILYKVLNLLFPKGDVSTTSSITYDTLNPQLNELHSYTDVFYSLRYKDARVKKVLWKFKYYLEPGALRTCTYILYDQLVADASDRVNKIPFRAPYIVLHYPSSSYFKGNKNFDQMKELTLLLDSLQNMYEPFFVCCTHAILPNRNSWQNNAWQNLQSQHTGSRKQRFEWSKQRFVLSPNFDKFMEDQQKDIRSSEKSGAQDSDQGVTRTHVSRTSHIYKTHIYCIDDVVTTGASMQAVSNVLQEKYNVKVIKFCICH